MWMSFMKFSKQEKTPTTLSVIGVVGACLIQETGSRNMAAVPATKVSLARFYGTRMRCNGLYASISALESTSGFSETGSSNVRRSKRL